MTRREAVYITALTLVYAMLVFYKLGDIKAPQTVWMPESEEVAAIDLGEIKEVRKFQYMMGARHDKPFELIASIDGEDWFYNHIFEKSNVFAWTERTLNLNARFFYIRPLKPGLHLQEAAFRDTDGNLLPIEWHSLGASALFDEQHLVPDYYDYMNSTYFDEIYHARTGYEFAHQLPVYENTHPPLGKNFIAFSVKLFGMTPFAWRLPGTLLGVLMVPLIYFFARCVFNSYKWALFAALIFTFDFMHFAQTRIATIDTYVTFFVMAMYLFMYLYIKREKQLLLCLCGICMGLAIASKWQGVYGALGLPLLFFPSWYHSFKENKKQAFIVLGSCFIWFVFVPVTIYTLSYIPFVLASGGGWMQTILNNQKLMFNYHSTLEAVHPYSSRWWEWPLNIRPIWFFVNYISADVRQGISSFGNPAVWWTGIAAAVYAVIKLIWKRDFVLLFLLIAYAAQFMPWVAVSRATFIYHYFPSVPFVVLLITYLFKDLRYGKYAAYTYAAAVVFLFFMFYPVLSGMPISVDFVHTYLRWLPGWVLL